MITVFVAICALSMPVQSCNKDTALDWIVAPQRPASAVGCMLHGQRYAAASRLVTNATYVKVFCRTHVGKPSVASR